MRPGRGRPHTERTETKRGRTARAQETGGCDEEGGARELLASGDCVSGRGCRRRGWRCWTGWEQLNGLIEMGVPDAGRLLGVSPGS